MYSLKLKNNTDGQPCGEIVIDHDMRAVYFVNLKGTRMRIKDHAVAEVWRERLRAHLISSAEQQRVAKELADKAEAKIDAAESSLFDAKVRVSHRSALAAIALMGIAGNAATPR